MTKQADEAGQAIQNLSLESRPLGSGLVDAVDF